MHARQAGFTVVELMVVVVVLGALATFTVPALGAMMSRNRVAAYVNDVMGAAKLARREAIRRRQAVALCGTRDFASCDSGGWHTGILVFVDADADGALGGGEEVLSQAGPFAGAGVEIRNFAPAVYVPGGTLRAAGTRRLDICSESLGRRRSMSVLFLVGGKAVGVSNGEGFACS